MEKKPSIYVNKIDRKINNNKKIFFSSNQRGDNKVEPVQNNKSVDQQIKEIFNSNSYIYKANVEIVTKDKKITKKLIGRNNKYLITMDNELIPISEILEINSKDE